MSSPDSQPAANASTPLPPSSESKQLIIVNSAGSMVPAAELHIIMGAIATLLPEVCKCWNRMQNLTLSIWDNMVANGESAQSDAMHYFLIDDHQNLPAAFKSVSESVPIKVAGIVLTKPIFAASGVTVDSDGKRPSVAAALFKSIAESLINPANNLWWHDSACGELVSAKICDPVENIPVVITIAVTKNVPDSKSEDEMPALEPAEPEKINVTLCDFVLPAWSDAASSDSRFDFVGVLKSPFEVASGGCTHKYEPHVAGPRLNFDRRMPVWRRENRKVQMILDAVNMRPSH